MSTNAKIVIGIVVVVVVLAGAWWWMSSNNAPVATAPTNTEAPTTQPAPATTPAPSNTTPSANPAPAATVTDNSNAALQASLSNVDSKMNGFTSDNASVNQGMNDQPVQQQQL